MVEKIKGKMESFFYLCFIPFLLTAVFGIILLNFLDIPVWRTVQEWGNEIPVINQFIPGSANNIAKNKGDSDYYKQHYFELQSEIKKKDQKISKLNDQINSIQKGMKDLKNSNDELQKQLDEKQSKKLQEQMRQVAGIYTNLPPSKAAAMFESMSLEDASLTMSQLDQDQQSSILGSMKDSKKAAQITMMLKKIAALNAIDPVTLQDQVHELVQKQANPTETLAETIGGMEPAQAADIIKSMIVTNEQAAMELIKNVNINSRTQILSEIAKTDAKLAAQITANLNN